MHLVICIQLISLVNQPSIHVIKKEIEHKKSLPNLVFMGKILMIGGGVGTLLCSIILSGRQGNMEPDHYRNFLKTYESRLEYSYGMFIAGAFGYCIGIIKYNQTNPSLKSLFSRPALAQKIFNI